MRGSIALVGLLFALGVGGFVEVAPRPVAQLDLYVAEPVGNAVIDAARRGAVGDIVRTLGPDRAGAMVRSVRGGAWASEPTGAALMRAVEVDTVAPHRLRIRVATSDLAEGQALAARVQGRLAAAGVRERIAISSVSHAGWGLTIAYVTLFASLAVLLGCGLNAALRWFRRTA